MRYHRRPVATSWYGSTRRGPGSASRPAYPNSTRTVSRVARARASRASASTSIRLPSRVTIASWSARTSARSRAGSTWSLLASVRTAASLAPATVPRA